MGYFYVLLSVAANAAKAASSKFVSRSLVTLRSNMTYNGVRNTVSALLALLLALTLDKKGLSSLTWNEALIYAVSGVSMVIFTLSWTVAVRGEAYMLVSTFNSANFIIPCAVGIAFLDERFTLGKALALILIAFSILLLVGHNLKIKGRLTPRSVLTLLLVLASGGVNSTMQKLYSVCPIGNGAAYYTFYTFFIAGTVMMLISAFMKNDSCGGVFNGKSLKHLAVMSVGMLLATYFQTLAARSLDAMILYPTVNALSLIAGGVMSSLLFKERLTWRCIVGTVIVFFALMLSRL